MLPQTVTHYFPWTDSDTHATCGARITTADVHSTQPTCAACADRLAAEEAAIEETPLPLDADEARTELSPADALFAWAVDLTRSYAATITPRVDLLAVHAAGECGHDCGYCAERDALHGELVRLYTARRPDFDALDEVEERLIALGHAADIAVAARDAQELGGRR